MRASITRPWLGRRPVARWPFANRHGITTLEYGLIAGLIAVVCLAAINLIGPQVGSIFYSVDDAAQTASQATSQTD